MRKGFTLIELTFVLMIVGLIIGMGLDFAGPMLEKSKRDEDRAKMRTIENSLLTYLKTHGKYPCPARRDLATTNSGFGASTDCSAVAPSGTTDVSPEGIRIGVVPVRELNLPPTYMFDSYKNRITYAAIKGLAQTNTLYDSYTTAGVAPDTDGVGGGDTDGIITVVDANGTQITNVHNKIIVPYVLVSHGKDGLGSYKKTGAANAACDASHKDGANCDNNNIFRDVEYLDVAGSNYFDDVIRWKTKDRMEVEAGKLSITTGTGGVTLPTCTAGQTIYHNGTGFVCSPTCTEDQILKYQSGAWVCGRSIEGTLVASFYDDDSNTSATDSFDVNLASYPTARFFSADSFAFSAYANAESKTYVIVYDVSNTVLFQHMFTYSIDGGDASRSAGAISMFIPANATKLRIYRVWNGNSIPQPITYQLYLWK